MTKHTLNRLPKTATAEQVIEKLRADGYCIIEDLAGNALMDKIAEELDPWIERTCYGRDQLNGLYTRRTGALIARSVWVRKLIMDPLVLSTVGPGSVTHTLSSSTRPRCSQLAQERSFSRFM
jgi:hypothetical protein